MSKSDISGVTSYFPTINEGFGTTLGVTAAHNAATLTLASVSGLVNGSIFVGMIEPGETAQQVFTGTVNTGTSQITGVVWTRGSDAGAGHVAGAVIVDYVTGTAINMITTGILKSLSQDGTLKRSAIAPTTTSITSSASPTPNVDTTGLYIITALATNPTFGAPTGTPVDAQSLTMRIKDNGTSRTLSWNAVYRALGVALPTATSTSKTLYLQFLYNAVDTKWDLVSLSQQA